MLTTFLFGVIGIYFLGTIVPRKYKPIISAVGLFCCDKFEETPNEKVVNMSKLTKSYFRQLRFNGTVTCVSFPDFTSLTVPLRLFLELGSSLGLGSFLISGTTIVFCILWNWLCRIAVVVEYRQ